MKRINLLINVIDDALFGWLKTPPHEQKFSASRINREVKDQDLHRLMNDEASIRCMARVKQRMLMGSACPHPPLVTKGTDDAQTA